MSPQAILSVLHSWSAPRLMAVFLMMLLPACTTVPKEVVQMSYLVGEDIAALEQSYRALVAEHYKGLRAERERYLQNRWIPAYLADWIATGRLVELAQGRIVWSPEKRAFIAPSITRASQELLESVLAWSEAAIADIEDKRSSLAAPLDKEEKVLLASVEEAFTRIRQGNAAVTAHLNSIRRVQEVEGDFLKALGIKDLREQIIKTLANSSERARESLEAVQSADKLLDKAHGNMNR